MRSLFAFLICIAFITTSISTIESKIIRVPEDFPKIAEAVSEAKDRDTIKVAPGVYDESIFVYDKGLTIQGSGAKVTKVKAIGFHDNERANRKVKIDGFSAEGIGALSVAATISNNIVGSITIRDSAFGVTVENNLITGRDTGINCDSDFDNESHILIKDNVIMKHEKRGIDCGRASPKIRGNRITQNKRGVYISGDYPRSPDLGTEKDKGRNAIYNNTEIDILNVMPAAFLVFAIGNYWGSPFGPEAGGVVFKNTDGGRIEVTPWSTRDESAYFPVEPLRKLATTWGRIKLSR